MYNDVVNKIKEYDTIVIARHIGVDPDALCSQLALRDSIRLTFPEKKVLAIGTGSSKFLNFGKLDKIENVSHALLIVTDTPDQKRVDSLNFSWGDYRIKIDHHPFVEKYCDLEWIDDSRSSTSEMILNLIFSTELRCDASIAELLYMGIVSDSNRFLFNSCDSYTFQAVSKLLEAYPIDLGKTYEKLYLRPMNEVRLEGYISLHMEITEHHLGYVVISDEVISEFGVDSASAGNMINDFNYIKEVLVWATITEDKKNDQYRVSIRSRGPEINKVVEKYNGGGHKYACGVRTKTLDDALNVIHDLDCLLEENDS